VCSACLRREVNIEKFLGVYAQRLGYLEHLADARVDDAPLDAAYLAEFQVGSIGQALLGEAFCQPYGSHVFRKCFDARLVPCLFFHGGNFPLCLNFSFGKYA
jgi:hypothetical protein